ncbi:phospholipid scramblase 1-like isoform X2 [Megalobrama amblycephala]|uniref:phospholipid scramblase 1-like isoform X2 n=1 Tax=Megalobrama amblycephala TaxID=75352 RepID=UPI0020141160|nr:phospholipid scramblase 1-like isoform X2 [Megalobrama amblycephala]
MFNHKHQTEKKNNPLFVMRETFTVLAVPLPNNGSVSHCYIQSNMELSEDTAMIPCPDPYHCPSHLETLTLIDQLFVYKEKTLEESLVEGCCGIKSNNRYEVKDDIGNKVFTILEDNDCCNRTYCAAARSFIMNVFNNSNQEIIRLVRPFVCSCCKNELVSLNGAAIDRSFGKIVRPFSCCGPNADADFVLRFPRSLEVKMKATLLGACILIDCIYYEELQ